MRTLKDNEARVDRGRIEQAEALAEIKSKKQYNDAGFVSWQGYIDARYERWGISRQHADDLIKGLAILKTAPADAVSVRVAANLANSKFNERDREALIDEVTTLPRGSRDTSRDTTARRILSAAAGAKQRDPSLSGDELVAEAKRRVETSERFDEHQKPITEEIEFLDIIGELDRAGYAIGRQLRRLQQLDLNDGRRAGVRESLTQIEHTTGWLRSYVESGEVSFEDELKELLS